MSFLGGLIGAVGNLFGAKMGADAQIKGGKKAAKATLKANAQNIAYQKQFARSGIRWRVRDAKLAGIHPLAALGAQTVAFSPSSVGATQAGEALGAAGVTMGQGISRAATALGDIDDRNAEYIGKLQSLQLENMKLQNAAIASQVANLNQPGNPPASPTNRWLVDGQGQTTLSKTPLVQDTPLKRVASDPERPYSEPAAVTDIGFTRTSSGFAPVMSTDAKERLEEDTIGGLTWNLRNRVLQNLQVDLNPPYKAPAGKYWYYSPLRQQYELHDSDALQKHLEDRYSARHPKQYGPFRPDPNKYRYNY